MHDINVPIVVGEPLDRGEDVYGRYDAMSLMDVIRIVQDGGIDMGREHTLISAMVDEGLIPIQIRMPEEPDTYIIRHIYSAAFAVDAVALVIYHNNPHGNASIEDDISRYDYIKSAGYKIGIPLLDYIILDGGMASGISDTPTVVDRWKALWSAGCRLSRQPFLRDGKCYYVMSAYLPDITVEKKKPFTIGI